MPCFNSCRERLSVELRGLLPQAGTPGAHLLRGYERGGGDQLRILLGDLSLPPCPAHEHEDQHSDHAALARWTTDKAVKQFLNACWKLRTAMMGVVRVSHGHVEIERSTVRPADVVREQSVTCHTPLPDNAKQYWARWIRRETHAEQTGRVRRKKRAAFYAVLKGRVTGVCYTWADCARRVVGFPGACFRGCDTLQEAERLVLLSKD